MRSKIVFLAVALLCGTFHAIAAVKVVYRCPETSVTQFAESELTRLFDAAALKAGVYDDYTFVFARNGRFTAGEFAYRQVGKNRFLLEGGDQMGIVHAVHALLESLGYLFEVGGVVEPERFDFHRLSGANRVLKPHVRWRGVRQHVNFPMDISSYPLEEAKAYVANLVRMKFNKLVVHSYVFHWYDEVVSSDSTAYAGHFFYGNRHEFAGSPILRSAVRFNDSVFCIPEAEPVYDREQACSEFAKKWMSDLLTYAKSLGMRVQFSFEPRRSSVDRVVALAHTICRTYPQIDDLEIMTEETGGWGAPCSRAEVRDVLVRHFGAGVLSDTLVMNRIRDRQPDLAGFYDQVGTNVAAVGRLNADPQFRRSIKELKIGLYCSITDFTEPAYHLVRRHLPGTFVSIMPSHGSRGVANAFGRIVKSKEDLAMTELYSWIEFDGLMYLQQNAVGGMHSLLEQMDARSGGEQLHSVVFNHWRTAENRTAFRYAADVTAGTTVSPVRFYADYSRRLGIGSPASFCRAQELLNRADDYATVNLGNIGFCWVGAWSNGGSYTWMSSDNIKTCTALYLEAGELLSESLEASETRAAVDYLSLLGNRVLASVLYLNAFDEATAIRHIPLAPDGKYTGEQSRRAAEICDYALTLFEQYMAVYARILPDRGSEGTLVSVWNAPMHGLRVLRNKYSGVPLSELPHCDKAPCEPPLPVFYEALK